MKLIIDIPKEAYEYVKATSYLGWLTTSEYAYVIKNGIPLDDVKAEIETALAKEGNTDTAKAQAIALSWVLELLNNIGKAESEDME